MAVDKSNYISELNISNPPNSDPRTEGAAQMRTIKRAVNNSFPNVNAPVEADAARMNLVFNEYFMATGMVMMWTEADNTIPEGWKKADGTIYTLVGGGIYATPDLRGLFIKGTSDTELSGASGGSEEVDPGIYLTSEPHELIVEEIPAHGHEVWSQLTDGGSDNEAPAYPDVPFSGESSVDGDRHYAGDDGADDLVKMTGGGLGHSHDLTSTPMPNQPPYYVLTYIVYVGVGATAS